MVFDKSQAGRIKGQTLFDRHGDKVGKIGQVYLDAYNDEPEWITVNTGLFGTNESFVPLAEASSIVGGLAVPYSKDTIKDAPNIEDSGRLSEEEEQELYEHYDVPYTTDGSTFADTSQLRGTSTGTSGTGTAGGTGETVDEAAAGRQVSGADEEGTSGTASAPGRAAGAGEAMTRSEERLTVGTEKVQTGRARLRKWVETESQQVEVPVRREKAVLTTEPITEENAGDAFEGSKISEDEHVVTLNEERPVVSVEAVPVERVRLDTEVEENTQTVQKDIRKERVELDDENADGESPADRR